MYAHWTSMRRSTFICLKMRSKQERIPVIDFLRGLSCLGVLLYHVRVDLWIGWWRIRSYPEEYSAFAKWMSWLSVPTPFLGYAILLFFLISGFCIHFPNTKKSASPNWKNYLARRFWRIYPPYLAAIALSGGLTYFCHLKWGDTTWDWERIIRVATLSQNYPPKNGQFLGNPSFWTIPLETEFYLLYPLAFSMFFKFRTKTLWVLALGISGFSIYLGYLGIIWPSFTAFFLWPVWLAGAWVARLHREQKLAVLSIPLLLFVCLFSLILGLSSLIQKWESWLQYFVWTMFYFSFFILCIKESSNLNKVFGRFFFSAISWVGKISFSLYLIHFSLFKVLGYLHLEIWKDKPANFLVTLAYIIPVIFFAWLFFLTVESPIHKWSKKNR